MPPGIIWTTETLDQAMCQPDGRWKWIYVAPRKTGITSVKPVVGEFADLEFYEPKPRKEIPYLPWPKGVPRIFTKPKFEGCFSVSESYYNNLNKK